MTGDFDNSLTFGDLLLRLAESVDVADQGSGADNRAEVPTDPNLLDRLQRAINDAAAELARRHRWSWLTPSYVLTMAPDGDGPRNLAGDACRYLLPAALQSVPFGRVTWRDPTDTYGGEAMVSNWDRLDTMRAASPALTGAPRMCGVYAARGVTVPAGARQPLEFVVYPKPDQAYTVRARFRAQVPRMADRAERGIWGEVHDHTVLAVAKWKFMRTQDDGYAEARADADAAIATSIGLDGEMQGRRLGVLRSGDETDGPRAARTTRGNVNDFDGSPIITY